LVIRTGQASILVERAEGRTVEHRSLLRRMFPGQTFCTSAGMPNASASTPTALQQQLETLAAFPATAFPVLSLYLDLSADQHGRDHYGPFVRKVFAERLKGMPQGPGKESFRQDVERIQRFLGEELSPSANGLAIFACSGQEDFFATIQLESAFPQHWLFTGSVPHLYPLLRLMDQFPRYAAVMFDTTGARIFVFGLNTIERTTEVVGEKTRRTAVGGWSQARYQRHVDNTRLHNIKDTADALDRIVTEEAIARVVLVGDDTAVALLREQLPSRLADMLIDVIKLDRSAGHTQVLEATLEALRHKDAETDVECVEQMLGAWRGGGLGVAGPEATLQALHLGQLDELILTSAPETLKPVQRLPDGPLPAVAAETSEPAGPPELAKLELAGALVSAAQHTGARIRFIEDARLLAEVGGVGGLLRFRL
jgi:peptide chain release factor subunit 1